MISDAKLDANRRNALKSTGPKSAAGKARSSRNAETHGLTAQPGEPTAAYQEALAEWVDDLRPKGVLERTLTERACRAAWNLRRCDRHEDAVAFRKHRDAAEDFSLAEAHRAEEIGRRLVAVDYQKVEVSRYDDEMMPEILPETEDPALLVADLRRTAAGVNWLLARWGELDRALKTPEGWSEEQRTVAGRLLGLRRESLREHPLLSRVVPRSTALEPSWNGRSWFEHPDMQGVLDAAEEAEARGVGSARTIFFDCLRAVAARERGENAGSGPVDAKKLQAMVRSQREKLARLMRRVLKANEDDDRAGASDRAMFEESRSLTLCLRYATASSRDFHRAIRDLMKLRASGEGEDHEPPQPPSGSGDRPDPEPPATGPEGDENPSGGNAAKLRNEATEGPATTGAKRGDSRRGRSERRSAEGSAGDRARSGRDGGTRVRAVAARSGGFDAEVVDSNPDVLRVVGVSGDTNPIQDVQIPEDGFPGKVALRLAEVGNSGPGVPERRREESFRRAATPALLKKNRLTRQGIALESELAFLNGFAWATELRNRDGGCRVLSQSWFRSWPVLTGGSSGEEWFETLQSRYREPHRFYHTLQHLAECLVGFSAVRDRADHPEEVEVALWFHDAVYEVRENNNEVLSATLARDALRGSGGREDVAERVFQLVLATQHRDLPQTLDEQWLVDVDLSILGASVERFDEYEAQIRREYSWVEESVYRGKRREVLQGFLARPAIYVTPHFRKVLEASARENLMRSVARLAG